MASEFVPIALSQLWQVTLLILVVAAVNRWATRQRPHLSHLLWLVVLLKCVTPPLWASSGGVFCWLQPEVQIETTVAAEWVTPPPDWEQLLEVDSQAVFHADDSGSEIAGVILEDAEADELLQNENVVEMPTIKSDKRGFGEVVIVVWLGVVLLVLLAVIFRWLKFWRLVRSSSQRESPELVALLDSLSRQLGVRRRVRLIVTESLVGPAVIGFFRVTVLIPGVVADKLQGKAVAPILAHELLHIRRGDLWVGLLQTLAQAMWWFHPLVWWVGRVTTREAERCCDEEVLGELNCDPASYARALLDVLDLKSQLQPVPVFPGVRPVDVTSQRLERIMTLRQGCRRRSPWWCWLVAMMAAAVALPGAAFVVSAQDEEPLDALQAQFPAPQVDGQPRPARSVLEGQLVRAYNLADHDSAETTHVYATAEFAHLLGGSEVEQRQKLEQLIRSREQAKDAEINWFDDRPVVRTTNAGHRAVRECIAVLLGSDTTAKQFDEFLDNVTKRTEETVVVDLQFVTMNDSSYSAIEDELIEVEELDDFPLVLPTEKWDSLLKAVPHDDAWYYLAPQLAVFNGRTVHIESVAQHPPVTVRSENPYRTHGGLPGASDWVGWKALALPVVHDDDTFWLGMRFEVRSLAVSEEDSAQLNETEPLIRRHEVGFTATLREGQVVVLPGLNVNYGRTSGSSGSTFLAARIRMLDPTPVPNAVPSPKALTGIGVKSDSSITGEFVEDLPPAADRDPVIRQVGAQDAQLSEADKPAEVDRRQMLTRRSLGPLLLTLSIRGDGAVRPRATVLFEDADGNEVLAGTADDVQITERHHARIIEMVNANLKTIGVANHQFIAKRLRLIFDPDENPQGKLRMQLEAADVEFESDGRKSNLSARWIDLLLNVDPFTIEEAKASKMAAVKTEVPVVSTQQDDPAPNQSISEKQSQDARETAGERTHRILNQLVAVSFPETPLDDVLRSLSKSHGLNIALDARGLEEEGLRADSVVSIEVSGITLRSALNLILEPMNLTTTIDEPDGVLIVTSHERAGGKKLVVAYAVADLVIPVPAQVRVESPGTVTLPEADTAATADASRTQISPWRVAAPLSASESRTPIDCQKLIGLITETIEPDSWSERGGAGSIVAHGSSLSLVIRATPAVHEQIRDLLIQLRRMRDVQVTLLMQTLDVPQTFLAEWNSDPVFKPLSESKSHRYMRLSSAQADALRQAAKFSAFPKVTLFNGQLCELRMDAKDGMKQNWHVQPVVSGDRRSVRLGVGIIDGRSGVADEVVPTSVITVSDGDAILIEVDDSTEKETRNVGEPVPGQTRAFRRVSQSRRFVLIQPRVVTIEEEKELLSIDTEQ